MSKENNTRAGAGKVRIGIVGAGVMGRGIAQLFLQAGCPVWLYDTRAEARGSAAGFIRKMIGRQVEKGKYPQSEADAMLAGLSLCPVLDGLASCQVVIEAVVELLDVKRQLFAELEQTVSPEAILASNTSSLLVSDIAAACARPQRVAGLHFFNPVPLMRLVEVIPATLTDAAVVEELAALVSATGHRAVIAADQPGFLVNHAGRGYVTEALRILEEGVAQPAGVDRVMREAMGFRMGPFELLDLTGLDVSGKVMQSVYDQFLQEPMYRPSALVPPRMAAGLFGRKSGRGFYRYEDNRKIEPGEAPAPQISLTRVWLDSAESSEVRQLADELKTAGAQLTDSPADGDTIAVLQPWGGDVSHACAELDLDPACTVAVDPLPDPGSRRTLMLSPVTSPEVRDSMHGLLAAGGVPVTVINDSPGFISQRILAVIVNIAANIAQRRIASVPDIEAAVTLGLGYPHGPLSWGDKVGGERIAGILDNLFKLTGDPRYRLSPWLRRRVECGVSLLTGEAQRC